MYKLHYCDLFPMEKSVLITLHNALSITKKQSDDVMSKYIGEKKLTPIALPHK